MNNLSNCRPTMEDTSGNTTDNPTNTTDQETLKVYAPVITHDVTLPNDSRKVPMVMVPVPDSRALMAIRMSTLSQLKDNTIEASKDEQQARDLLVWNDGIGTLNGCDLRFKINQLGCLELIDSDDESENQNSTNFQNAISSNSQKNSKEDKTNQINNCNNNDTKKNIYNESSCRPQTSANHTNESKPQKRAKVDTTQVVPIRQISPGASLLRDGPGIRRPKSSIGTNSNNSARSQASSLSLLKKIERNQNSIVLDKLIPKHRVESIKANVDQWTIEDVKKYINSIPGCTGYGELFESQQVCGKSLLYLDQKDLLDVINVKLGPAVKIYHAISLLK